VVLEDTDPNETSRANKSSVNNRQHIRVNKPEPSEESAAIGSPSPLKPPEPSRGGSVNAQKGSNFSFGGIQNPRVDTLLNSLGGSAKSGNPIRNSGSFTKNEPYQSADFTIKG